MVHTLQSDALPLIRSSLEAGAAVRLRIEGDSMRPTLRRGDRVTVRSLPVEQLRMGDIIVVQSQGDLVTHRLVAIHPGGWYTKGDAGSNLDPLITTEEMILGRVETMERSGRLQSTLTPSWAISGRFVGWLAWQEARAYQWLTRHPAGIRHRIKWWRRLFIIPFRLPLWLLAALRR